MRPQFYAPPEGSLADAVSPTATCLASDWPFRHIVCYDVFASPRYEALRQHFDELLVADKRFRRRNARYSALSLTAGEIEGPLEGFFAPDWRDFLAKLFDLDVTPEIEGGLHHHRQKSPPGWPHNDFNPGHFVPGWQSVADERRCDYQTGSGCADPVVRVRRIAMIYFLANREWTTGDGGEVGLFQSRAQPVTTPSLAYPPLNNTLVAFECNPESFHCFLGDNRLARNSLILWLHADLAEVDRRWGLTHLVPWRAGYASSAG